MVLKEHTVVDWHVCDTFLMVNFTLIGEDNGASDAIFWRFEKLCQRTMLRIVFSRLHFQRQHLKTFVVVNEEIHFALFLVVVIVQLELVGCEFLSDQRLIDSSQVNASDILQHGIHVDAIKQVRQQTDIIQI